MKQEKVIGLILAGGKNSRMHGQVKAFLEIEGVSFLERIVPVLQSAADCILLSVDDRNKYEKLLEDRGMKAEPFLFVTDRFPGIGPLGGIASGLLALEEMAGSEERENHKKHVLLTVPSDDPFISSSDIKALLAAYEQNPVLTMGEVCGRMQPLIGLYPAAVLPVLLQLIKEGNYRMMELLDRVPYQKVVLSDGAGININSPEDYELWCRK